jgi:dsDNA-binding SOS-regulon protein
MNIKYREIKENNDKGLVILYIDKAGDGNHIFEEDRILWDASEKGLALAEDSPIVIDDKKLVMVDSSKDLLGFYLLQEEENNHRVLEPYYRPTLNDMPPPAPKRTRSTAAGKKLDKEELDFYLKNLKEFLV